MKQWLPLRRLKFIGIMDKMRKKLIESVVFFAKSVKNPTKMMIYKLLAELDFRHFEEKGYPVTNLEYEAWPMGPVPKEFNAEITRNEDVELPDDFRNALTCEKFEYEDSGGNTKHGFRFRAKRKPDLTVFTLREQRILSEVAEIYREATATEASKASHEPGRPWSKTSKGETIELPKAARIPKPLTEEEAREMIREIGAFHRTYDRK